MNYNLIDLVYLLDSNVFLLHSLQFKTLNFNDNNLIEYLF